MNIKKDWVRMKHNIEPSPSANLRVGLTWPKVSPSALNFPNHILLRKCVIIELSLRNQ